MFTGYAFEQVAPHEIPLGREVTVPAPPPVLVTVKIFVSGLVLKVAVTVFAAFIVT